jgi:sigma-E factor negative regulatory protein RseC
MCYFGEGTERIIEISDFPTDTKIGDSVEILISRSMGNKAIVLGYLIPFLLLIGTLIVLTQFGVRDWISGLLSMAALLPYFLILYMLRDSLRKTFMLSARKNEN